jgi:alpha-1,2-mannosyltransferase
VGGFAALARRPALAGLLLGLLTYKPQFALLVPIALAASRQWRALAVAAAAACALALASVAAFGIEPWRVWLEWVAGSTADYPKWALWCRVQGESIYNNLRVLGASNAAANLGQAIAGFAAAGCVWWSYRRQAPSDLQLAVLLPATVLAAPHVANYDGVLIVVAATLLFVRGLDAGFRRGEPIVLMLAWAIQMFNPPTEYRVGVITPLLTMLVIACAISRSAAGAAYDERSYGDPPSAAAVTSR